MEDKPRRIILINCHNTGTADTERIPISAGRTPFYLLYDISELAIIFSQETKMNSFCSVSLDGLLQIAEHLLENRVFRVALFKLFVFICVGNDTVI